MNSYLRSLPVVFQVGTLIILLILKVFKEEKIINVKKYKTAWILILCSILFGVILDYSISLVYQGMEDITISWYVTISSIINYAPIILVLITWIIIYEVITGEKLLRKNNRN